MAEHDQGWVLSDGTVVLAGDPPTISGDSALALELRQDLLQKRLPVVGIGEHVAPLDVTSPDSVAAWLITRAYEHGATVVSGHTLAPRPRLPPGHVY